MTTHVSDSEDEESIFITKSNVSKRKFVSLVLQSNQRLAILPHYKQLFDDTQWNKLNDLNVTDVNDVFEVRGNQNSLVVSNQSLLNLPDVSQDEPINTNKNTNHHRSKLIQDLDLTGSILHLDSMDYKDLHSRRGLRRRTFAATHPYLVDSIKYLGLTSIDYLNDIFKENPDLDGILKLLNNSYTRLKKKYPKDDKYSKKDFYTVYGETKKAAQDQMSQEAPYKPNDTQDQINDVPYRMNDSQNIPMSSERDLVQSSDDDEDQLITSRRNISIINNQLSDESDDSLLDSSSDDNLVRVGGRYLKEQNVLRGALPESAKRLNLYKNTSKKHRTQQPPKNTQARKGLARKKIATPSSKRQDTFIDLIDDNPQIDDDNHSIEDSRLSLDIFDILSDVSATEDTDDGLIVKGYKSYSFDEKTVTTPSNPTFSIDDIINDISDNSELEGYESIFELDMINPLAYGKSVQKKQKSSLDRMKQQTLGSSRKSGRVGTPTKKKSNYKRTKGVSSLGSKRRKYNRSSLSGNKPKNKNYGQLKTKTITKPPAIKQTSSKSIDKTTSAGLEGFPVNKKQLVSQYEFLRDPHQSTIQFEVESEKYISAKAKTAFKTFTPTKLNSSFPRDFIMNLIDIEEIQKLKSGKSYIPNKDSVTITLVGNTYILTTLEVFKSQSESEKLLATVQRLLKDQPNMGYDSIASEIYEAVSGLLQWHLIIQSRPSERTWKLVQGTLSILSLANSTVSGEKSMHFYPLFALFNYILIVLEEINGILERRVNWLRIQYLQACESYWPLFFNHFNLQEIETIVWQKSRQSESFHIMYKLLSLDNRLWLLVNNALVHVRKDPAVLLEDVLSLVTFIPPKSYNWSCFYTIYQNIGDEEDSMVYNRFLDAIELLHQRFGWPIDEKLILLLYDTITSRRFGNFLDEWIEPDLICKIGSRNDMPDCSFFERFMKLLYGYISDKETYDKRLITKLFTSSKYKFEPNREHFIMFVNRMNFILLLFQCSKEDLNNQLTSLIESVQGLNDFNILELSVKSLALYTELSVEKHSKPPIMSFILIINELSSSYLQVPKIKTIWNYLLDALRNLSIVNPTALIQIFVELRDLPDRFAIRIFEILSSGIEKLNNLDKKLGNKLDLRLQGILHVQMGRYPIESLLNSRLHESIIKILIEIWLKVFSISSNPNWDKLILQTFPYIGNQLLREIYILYFYSVILRYTRLDRSKDTILNAVFRDLVSMASSGYLPQLIVQLNESNDDILCFSKDDLKNLQVINSLGAKKKLLTVILRNIYKSLSTHNVTKEIYIQEIVRALNSEFDTNHGNQWYREFCRTIILEVQKVSQSLLAKTEMIRSLANKLGILQEELDQFVWSQKPTAQKLADVHREFSHALLYNRDHHQALNKLVFSETELIYHLISLYLLAIILSQTDKWKPLFYILEFYYLKLKSFQFRADTPNLLRFLKMLSEVPWLTNTRCSELENTYRLQVFTTILRIFIYLHVLFDGYRDKDIIIQYSNDLQRAIMCSKSDVVGSLNSLFSSFKPFEIFHNVLETNIAVQELTDADSVGRANLQLRANMECLKRLNIEYEESLSLNDGPSPTIQCLSFDLN